MAEKKGRRIVDALDDLTAELRLANRIQAMQLGTTALEHDKGARSTTGEARARVDRRNALRADIRRGLGYDEEETDRG